MHTTKSAAVAASPAHRATTIPAETMSIEVARDAAGVVTGADIVLSDGIAWAQLPPGDLDQAIHQAVSVFRIGGEQAVIDTYYRNVAAH